MLHIIDLDAAMGKPANDDLSRDLCVKASAKYKIKVRVGGGIRSIARAVAITKWGAALPSEKLQIQRSCSIW